MFLRVAANRSLGKSSDVEIENAVILIVEEVRSDEMTGEAEIVQTDH